MRHISICPLIHYKHVIYPSIKSNPQVLKSVWGKCENLWDNNKTVFCCKPFIFFFKAGYQAETNVFNGILTAPNQQSRTSQLSTEEAQGILDSRDKAALARILVCPIRFCNVWSLAMWFWGKNLDFKSSVGDCICCRYNLLRENYVTIWNKETVLCALFS